MKFKRVISTVITIIMLIGMLPSMDVSAASGADISAKARQFIGYPYIGGTQGPDSFDCSGLVQYVFKQYGISLPASANQYANWSNYGTKISDRSQLKSGDVLCFSMTSSESNITHVGIYDGSTGEVVHALNENVGVVNQSLENIWIKQGWKPPYMYAIRVYGVDASGTTHTHSYSGYYYDNSHPHAEYRKCSCGVTSYTGNYGYVSSCGTCNPPVSVSKWVDCRWKIFVPDKVDLYNSPECSDVSNQYIAPAANRELISRRYAILSNGLISYEVNLMNQTYYIKSTNVSSSYVMHLYNQTLYEETHPHKAYYICGCGEKFYLSGTADGIKENCSQCLCYITYDANGGYNAPETQSAVRESYVTLSSVIPKRDGYVFLGWAKTSDATHGYSAGYTNFSVTENTTLYAVWAENGGQCGEAVYWRYDEDIKTLTVFGKGKVTEAPWRSLENNLKNFIIEDGIDVISDIQMLQQGDLDLFVFPSNMIAINHSQLFGHMVSIKKL